MNELTNATILDKEKELKERSWRESEVGRVFAVHGQRRGSTDRICTTHSPVCIGKVVAKWGESSVKARQTYESRICPLSTRIAVVRSLRSFQTKVPLGGAYAISICDWPLSDANTVTLLWASRVGHEPAWDIFDIF